MKTRTIIPAVLIAVLGGGAIAVAAGGGHGDRKAHKEARIERMFERLDANADGAIDAAELETGRKNRFTEADANGDGQLSEQEIIAAAEKRAGERARKMAGRMIDHLDADDDGVVTLAEYDAHTGERGARMMKRLDADGDGVITREEANAAKGPRHGHD